ncbi:hypothetical protein B296_00010226 [Ensete ventricosum]|uniref:ATP-dependent RNA helicase n=1 Tax=Ensete ventricosum TaxID=4639 RepID=A0A426XY63_ENSVE|nr:hypothetical protein B296_00010226 [Ensete ventricosum]
MGDDSQHVKRVPHLPWMRNPVDIDQFEERPLGFLPSLDSRFFIYKFKYLMVQVKEVFSAIAPAVGLRVGLAVGQSSIADEISELIERPKLGSCSPFDPEDVYMELQTAVDILVATPGRLMDHINMTKGFSLEHLCYLVNEQIYIWITFSLTVCRSKLKPLYLVALLQTLGAEKSIVFTSSVESTHRLSTLLKFFGELPFKISEYSRRQRQPVRR